jgi:Rod binding domain-containing protein
MSGALEATSALGASSGLPVANEALEPASVRNGSPATKKAYTAALDFEEMLVQQLSQSMIATSGLGESGEGESEAEGASTSGSSSSESLPGFSGSGSGQLASLLPQSLTEGVMDQGGLGIAQQLVTQLNPAASTEASAGGSSGASTGGSAGASMGVPAAGSAAPVDASGGVSA